MSKEKIRHAISIYCGSESDAEALYHDIIKILSEQQNYCNICGDGIGNSCKKCDLIFEQIPLDPEVAEHIDKNFIELRNAKKDASGNQYYR